MTPRPNPAPVGTSTAVFPVVCTVASGFGVFPTCSACGRGRYAFGGGEYCDVCPAGAHQPATKATECLPCPADTFADGNGTAVCTSCPEKTGTGVLLPTGKTSRDACVCIPGYLTNTLQERQASGAFCRTCSAGLYYSASPSPSCFECPAHSQVQGQLVVLEDKKPVSSVCGCFQGYQLHAEACQPCPLGTFKANANNSACLACPLNSTTLGLNSTQQGHCICNAGLKRVALGASFVCENCPDNYYRSSQAADSPCIPCALGKFSVGGASTCTNCVNGFSTKSGVEGNECAACLPGKFALSGDPACVSCAKGSFASTSGASTCSLCDPGFSRADAGAVSCSQCGWGQFAAARGATVCLDCAAGKHSAESFKSTTCVDCISGTFMANPGQKAVVINGVEGCNACGAGTFSKGSASVCSDCPVGQFAGSSRSVSCTQCGQGRFASAPKSTECKACAYGAFNSGFGATTCKECPGGSNTTSQASTEFDDCKCSDGRFLSADSICMKYWAVGVQRNVPITSITAGGEWTKCYDEPYSVVSTKLLIRCSTKGASVGSSVFLFGARRATEDPETGYLEIAAMGATRASATNPLPLGTTEGGEWTSPTSGSTGTVFHNGVYWYLTQKAFGFSRNESVNLQDQDVSTLDCEHRMGFILGGSGGYRVGCTKDLVSSTEWNKVVYYFSGVPGR